MVRDRGDPRDIASTIGAIPDSLASVVRDRGDPRDGSRVLVCVTWGSVVVCERWLVGWLPMGWLGCQGALVREGSVASSGGRGVCSYWTARCGSWGLPDGFGLVECQVSAGLADWSDPDCRDSPLCVASGGLVVDRGVYLGEY